MSERVERERSVSPPKRDLESLQATVETLQNGTIMEQLRASDEDMDAGRVRSIDALLDEL
ncbi:MAG: hypothetical protein SVU32_02830 [Candidatus Nanohaloarchaea archaeon]|nr:hypothetical protein [Candidatus Nanohaloarchaea archaeon]